MVIFKLQSGAIGAIVGIGTGLFGVGLMGLDMSYPVTSLVGFWLHVVGFSLVSGALVYGLARFALWCDRDTRQRARPDRVDVLQFRRNELLQRDARKDGQR